MCRYKKSIKEYMKTKDKTIILFERFINKNHHCHLQVVPISEEEGRRAKEAITAEAARRNIRFEPVSVPARDIAEVVEPDQSYITIELPSGYRVCGVSCVMCRVCVVCASCVRRVVCAVY